MYNPVYTWICVQMTPKSKCPSPSSLVIIFFSANLLLFSTMIGPNPSFWVTHPPHSFLIILHFTSQFFVSSSTSFASLPPHLPFPISNHGQLIVPPENRLFPQSSLQMPCANLLHHLLSLFLFPSIWSSTLSQTSLSKYKCTVILWKKKKKSMLLCCLPEQKVFLAKKATAVTGWPNLHL